MHAEPLSQYSATAECRWAGSLDAATVGTYLGTALSVLHMSLAVIGTPRHYTLHTAGKPATALVTPSTTTTIRLDAVSLSYSKHWRSTCSPVSGCHPQALRTRPPTLIFAAQVGAFDVELTSFASAVHKPRVIPGLRSQGDCGLESTTERSREQPTTSIAVRERNTPAGALPLRTVL